jgi:DNA-binding transcriptional regulator WhiA
LDELGHHADPPLTKDAVAGRIRRLLAMADKKAEDLGVLTTLQSVPDELESL